MATLRTFPGLLLLTLLLFAPRVQAQQPSFSDARSYHNFIVNQADLVEMSISQVDRAFEAEVPDAAFVRSRFANMQKQIAAAVKELESLGPWGDDASYRDAALSLMQFYDKISNNELKEMVDLLLKVEMLSDDEERLNELLDYLSRQEDIHTAAFETAQRNFMVTHALVESRD